MTEWISTKDQLPELHQRVVVISVIKGKYDGSFAVAEIVMLSSSKDGLEWIDDQGDFYDVLLDQHLYWMELPEPPKVNK